MRWTLCIAAIILATAVNDSSAEAPTAPYWLDVTKNCGPMCLHFLDKLLGGEQKYAEVAGLCPAGQDGVNLESLAAAARRLGYQTSGFRASAADLRRLRHPAVVRLEFQDERNLRERGTQDHFVVLVRWLPYKDAFLVYDPPYVLEERPYRDVARLYSGIALAVAKCDLASAEDAFHPRSLVAQAAPSAALLAAIAAGWAWLSRRKAARTLAAAAPLALLLLTGCQRGPVELEAAPTIAALPEAGDDDVAERFDAGRVRSGAPVVHVFRLTNGSPHPFTLVRLESACACGMKMLGEEHPRLSPGGSAELEVSFDTTRVNGPFEKKVTVHTDAQDEAWKAIRLELRGEAFYPAEAVPEELSLGDVPPVGVVERRGRIKLNVPGLADAFRGLRADHALLSAEVERIEADTLTYLVLTAKEKPHGALYGTVIATFDHPEVSEVKIPIRGGVTGALSVTPTRLAFAKDPFAPDAPVVKPVRLRAPGGAAFRVKDVNVPEGLTLVEQPGQEPLTVHYLKFAWAGGAAPTRELAIVVDVDLATQGRVVIPVSWPTP